jgi:hypothetical protein
MDAGDGPAAGAMRGGGSGSSVARKSDRSATGNKALRLLKGTDGRAASPEAAIRSIMRKLSASPIVGMDYDAMFDAYAVIREMTADEVQAALRELEAAESNPQVKMMLQMLLVNHWAKEDGREALEYIMANSDARMKQMGVMGGVMAWMREEPDAAYAWYQENKSSVGGGMFGGSGMIEGMMIAAMGQSDMAAAFEKIEGLGQQSRQMALSTMASQMGMDPDKRAEFLQHLEGMDDEALRSQTLQGLVSTWAWQDPQGAAEFIQAGDFDDATKRALRSGVAQSWAFMDPKGAMEWSKTNSEGEERTRQIEQTFSAWVQQDAEGAENWLQSQPDEIKTDGLYVQASQMLAGTQNFDKAVEYIDRIEDAGSRMRSMQTLHMQWGATDKEGMEQWLEGLDAPIRDELLKGAAQPGSVPWNVPSGINDSDAVLEQVEPLPEPTVEKR